MIFEDLLASCLWQTSHQPGWQTVFEEDKSFLQYFHLRTAFVSERQVPGLLIRSEWNSLYNGSHTKRVVTRTPRGKPCKDFTGFLLGSGRSASSSLRAVKGSELSHFIVVDSRAIADYLSSHCSVLVVMLQVDRFSEWPLGELGLEDRCDELRSDSSVYTMATRMNFGETDPARRALSSASQLMGKWILEPETLSCDPVHSGKQ